MALLNGLSPALASPGHEGVYVFSVHFLVMHSMQIDLNNLLAGGSAERQEIRVSWAVTQLQG